VDKLELFRQCDEHLQNDLCPSGYLRDLDEKGWLMRVHPFELLAELKTVEQSPAFHPEGDVWEHTLLVVDQAAANRETSNNPRVLMWASLLHDIGKIPTTKIRRGRITAYDHDREGARLARRFLQELTTDQDFVDRVVRMIRWHMQSLYVNKRLPFAQIDKMLSQVPLAEIALFSLCDRLGRGKMDEQGRQSEMAAILSFMEQCQLAENNGKWDGNPG